MPNRRRVFAACLFVAVIGTSAMIVAVVKVKAQIDVSREECAIANLVKAGAIVQRCPSSDGTYCFSVSLASCENCKSNDELLRYVADIGNVGELGLAPIPLYEAGRKSLFRLKGLAVLSVYVTDTGIAREAYAELKRQMKLRNPDIYMAAGDKDGKPVE